MIDDADSVIPADDDPRVAEILDRKGTLLGTRVVTEEGEDLGRIGDLYFDETSGRITGYEVSGGMLGDVVRGTSYLPFEHIRVIGTRRGHRRPATRKAVVDGQKGGLSPRSTAHHSTVAAPSRAADDQATDEGPLPTPPSHDPDGELVGARAQADLLDRDGSVVVANGQTVTLELIQRARPASKLDALYQAVGPDPAPCPSASRPARPCPRSRTRPPTCGVGSPRGCPR